MKLTERQEKFLVALDLAQELYYTTSRVPEYVQFSVIFSVISLGWTSDEKCREKFKRAAEQLVKKGVLVKRKSAVVEYGRIEWAQDPRTIVKIRKRIGGPIA